MFDLIARKRNIYLATYSHIDRRHAIRAEEEKKSICEKKVTNSSQITHLLFLKFIHAPAVVYIDFTHESEKKNTQQHLLIVLPLCLSVVRGIDEIITLIFFSLEKMFSVIYLAHIF